MQNEQALPIDIHSGKLLDWLISRRHCNRDNTNEILRIREKINNAIQDMPALDEITKLLSGTYINYFHCLKIVELLKMTESETKNIFGRYSSQRMKDWQEIVQLYKKDNIYLAEAAQMLIRNVNFEVPSLKKQVVKLQQVQEECDKKSNACIKNSNELREKYHIYCRQLGIKGDDVRNELMELMKDLPNTYEKLLELCRKIKEARLFYKDFAEYTLGKTLDAKHPILPTISYLIENGNTTTFEWKYGRKPAIIEETKFDYTEKPSENEDSSDVINFGDDNQIDFGDNQIDFGDSAIDYGNDINFDISLEPNNAKVEQSSGSAKDVAKGDNALTIFENEKTRNMFVNELYELESFLDQRIIEMKLEKDVLAMNQFEMAPISIQSQTAESVQVTATCVRDILNVINDVKMQKLFVIRASPRYVDRLTETLKQKLQLADKVLKQKDILEKQQKQAAHEEGALSPKIDLIIQKTKELQKEIESDISKRYSNRPVNIMGGISTL